MFRCLTLVVPITTSLIIAVIMKRSELWTFSLPPAAVHVRDVSCGPRDDEQQLQRDGHHDHGSLRHVWGERRQAGAHAGAVGHGQGAGHSRPSWKDSLLQQPLDRHPRHRQVLTCDLPRSLHALQHHILVHLFLTVAYQRWPFFSSRQRYHDEDTLQCPSSVSLL